MYKIVFSLLFVLGSVSNIFGQGIIRGTITDGKTTEPVPFAKVKVDGVNTGATTDFDGEFEINIKPGSYEIVISSLDGYLDQRRNVKVVDGEVFILDVEMNKGQDVQEVVVTGVRTEGATSRVAQDLKRQEERGATDGVTTEEMEEKGVTNVADALQTSPGLSVEDGKNVYVRGLGDRYTKTILNGMEIPGLDPDRNAVQLDIFPASVVDNITVYKTFLPNFSGDFTGGLVDITTKDFPSERTIYAKIGLGFNSMATFNKDYISYSGGAIDFLGFDDGTRALPVRTTDVFSHPVQGDKKLEKSTRLFSNTMATERASNFLDQNYAFTYGDRINFKKNKGVTYGYNLVLNYRNTHRFYEDVQYSEYRRVFDDEGNPVDNLDKFRASSGILAENNVIWTGLIGQSIKFRRTKISLALFHTQNGNSSSAQLTDRNFEQNPSTLVKQSLQYSQRSVTNANLSGRHFLDSLGKWKLDWKLSPTYSRIQDPDVRSTVLEVTEDANGETVYNYTPAVGSEIRRIWRYLTEYNFSGRFDVTYAFTPWKKSKNESWRGLKSEISFGALDTYKNRSFEVYDYLFDVENASEYSGDPNWYFEAQNIWTPESDTGTYVKGNKEAANTYLASQNVFGAYIMNDLPISSKFNATYGVRLEKVTNWYTGQNNTGTVIYDNQVVLDEWNVLPSINLVYKLQRDADSIHRKSGNTIFRNKMINNIRAAYAMTVARPSFKEKSIAQIYDPIQGRTFNGNIDLLQTTIHNADLRWEMFFGRTELISVSGFYKKFINPIELVAFNSAPNEVQPLNAGVADVFGGELEIRKAIGFKKEKFRHISLLAGANFTYVFSRINMNEVNITTGDITKTEREIRLENAREGEVIGNYRPMYGQSPYIINAFLTFKNDSLGLSLNLSYNVQGKKLAVIGIGSLPDVYEQPFHSLSFKASKTLDRAKNWQVSITAKNLLMSVRQKHYESYNAESQVYDYFNQGMSVSASISYRLRGRKKD
ncbi:MAG: carboxypeptidase-like regulatory domain-containing protein [Crocinitomicaceae bacterium]|nr:carboxypeptidase-like regulatory domain-containing protein [Crocinitomicaceae bacterium]